MPLLFGEREGVRFCVQPKAGTGSAPVMHEFESPFLSPLFFYLSFLLCGSCCSLKGRDPEPPRVVVTAAAVLCAPGPLPVAPLSCSVICVRGGLFCGRLWPAPLWHSQQGFRVERACPAQKNKLLGCRKRQCKLCMCMHEAVGLHTAVSDCLSYPCCHTCAPRMRVAAHLQACASGAGVAGGACLGGNRVRPRRETGSVCFSVLFWPAGVHGWIVGFACVLQCSSGGLRAMYYCRYSTPGRRLVHCTIGAHPARGPPVFFESSFGLRTQGVLSLVPLLLVVDSV